MFCRLCFTPTILLICKNNQVVDSLKPKIKIQISSMKIAVIFHLEPFHMDVMYMESLKFMEM